MARSTKSSDGGHGGGTCRRRSHRRGQEGKEEAEKERDEEEKAEEDAGAKDPKEEEQKGDERKQEDEKESEQNEEGCTTGQSSRRSPEMLSRRKDGRRLGKEGRRSVRKLLMKTRQRKKKFKNTYVPSLSFFSSHLKSLRLPSCNIPLRLRCRSSWDRACRRLRLCKVSARRLRKRCSSTCLA